MSGLPPGWVAQYDSQYQRNFYVNEATGASQWEPPVHRVAPPAGPPPGPPPGEYSSYRPPQQMQMAGAPYDQYAYQSQERSMSNEYNSMSSNKGYVPEKRGMSNKTKVGLGAAALVLGGVAIHEHDKRERERDEGRYGYGGRW